MINKEITSEIIQHIKNQNSLIDHNTALFNIYEGDLLSYVLSELKASLTDKAFNRIKPRIAPINVLLKIIDKLSKIYQQNVMREVINGTEEDAKLLVQYEQQLQINTVLNQSNEFFNLFKNNLIQPFLDPEKRMMRLRSIPSNQFTVWSMNKIIPSQPTHVALYHGKVDGKAVYCIYSDDRFVVVNEDNETMKGMMAATNNPEGIIPWGQMPFIYVNKSANKIIPLPDTDTLKMTTLIPILLSDLNYAVMYQAFSIMYGIDIEDKNLEMNPSAFWSFKSDPSGNSKPEVGMIKPQVDISETLKLIQAQLAFWLETRGIKAGSVGNLDGESVASGISKIIDEADTFEDRKKQIGYYIPAEKNLWDLILKKMHPYFVGTGAIDNKYIFTSTADVITKFPEQKPMVSRTDVVRGLKEERDAGFISTEKAIKKLNPEMAESEIEEMILEIENERSIDIAEVETDNGNEDSAS